MAMLKEHQVNCLAWVAEIESCLGASLLADDMRLGKSLSAYSRITLEAFRRGAPRPSKDLKPMLSGDSIGFFHAAHETLSPDGHTEQDSNP